MRNLNLSIVITAIVTVVFMFTGCGSSGSIMSEMTGTWKSAKDGAAIKINLSGEKKTIEIGGKTVPVTVEKVDEGAYCVKVNAKIANGKTMKWSLRQVWDDNGSNFTIKFDHNGEIETLTHT